MDVVNYKCPACSSPLKFDDKTQKWVCKSCDNVFTLENLKDFYDDEINEQYKGKPIDWMQYDFKSGSGEWTEEELGGLSKCRCESCGAEVIMDKNTSATSCAYCGNTVIIPEQMSDVFRPDYVIPFKLDKERAMAEYKKFIRGKRLLPNLFAKKNHIEELKGIYVPFWLFDSSSTGDFVFDAKKVKTYTAGNYNVTETDHYSITRNGGLSFAGIPADGSQKLADDYMEAIEPFNYKELVEFQPAYLSGYLSDKYDVTATECAPQIEERIRSSMETAMRSTVSGYSSVSVKSAHIANTNSDIKYCLLPVWLLNTKYNNKIYTFAMNGQTGKFVGKLPIDKSKVFKYGAGIFAGSAAIMYLLNVLFSAMGVM